MSALSRHAVSAFKRTTATALRTSAMSTLRPTSCAPRHLAASSQLPTRTFSVSAAVRSATATVQNDPKWKNGEKVTYDEVKPLTQSPSDKILLIDVREPNEVALGSIPSSVNLPLSTFEKNLSMDEGDFTRVNGFHKPTKQQPMIFYCRSGVRAQTAVDLAKAAGYKWARNYEGSYTDWQKHEESNPNKDD
ncbi:hypothetical protein JCM8115_005705 [Rhodotorula mucilaginosa]|uniref:Rhodanese domain-containing protein n=1 Tax=Rhodotorula mucilaginosa TaxID=5537 RepID=A0A9P6VXM7_RHOMI|nr:hypothetical protein C6P46_007003 [Rhodotorula mucilaginosa]TKA52047.1 hypothetical protein B0A53_04707 [Rhodotorula sp. CCFEE 5036]